MSSTNQSVLRDLQNGRDISTQLQKIFNNVTAKNRAQVLDLCKKTLSYVTATISNHGYQPFHLAIAQLRHLIPYLKKNGTSQAHIVSMVEKHSVNYALLLIAHKANTKLKVSSFLQVTIQLLFEARLASTSAKTSTKTKPLQQHEPNNFPDCLENSNKSNLPKNKQFLDILLFKGAQEYQFESLLPKRDSAQTALIITGALAARLCSGEHSLDLSNLEQCVRCIILPWAQYVQHVSTTQSERQHLKVYLNTIHTFLLEACHAVRQSKPFLVLSVRSLALRLGDFDVHSFAKNAIKCTNAFIRHAEKNKNQRQRNKSDAFIIDIHEEMVQHMLTFSDDDPSWGSEYVSALLDDVAAFWFVQNDPQTLPQILVKRISILSHQGNAHSLIKCCEWQLKLIQAGAYNEDMMISRQDNDTEKLISTQWERVAEIIKEFTNLQMKHSDVDCIDAASKHAFILLRILRIIEPSRKLLFPLNHYDEIPAGAKILLNEYSRIAICGVQILQTSEPELLESKNSANTEIHRKLQDMLSGALQGILEFIKREILSCNATSYFETISLATQFLNVYNPTDPKERSFIESSLTKLILQQFSRKLKSHYAGENLTTSMSKKLTSMMERTLTWLESNFDSCSSIQTQKIAFLQLLREFYAIANLTDLVLISSARLLYYVLEEIEEDIHDADVSKEVAQTFLADFQHVNDQGAREAMFSRTNLTPELVLSLLMESDASPTSSKRESIEGRQAKQKPEQDLLRDRYQLVNFIDHDQCLLWKLHRLWLEHRQHGLTDEDEAELSEISYCTRSRGMICDLHNSGNIFDQSPVVLRTEKDHVTVITHLADIWQSVKSGKVARIGITLGKVSQVLGRSRNQSFYPELIQTAWEVLSWITTLLIKSDNMHFSAMANDLAYQFGIYMGKGGQDAYFNYLFMQLGKNQSSIKMTVESKALQYSENGKHNEALALLGSKQDAMTTYVRARIMNFGKGEVVEAIVQATNSLKFHLRDLKTSLTSVSAEDQIQIAGSPVSTSLDLESQAGQHRFVQLLTLIECMNLLGNLHVSSESLDEACYFFKQSSILASKCLSSNHRAIKSIHLQLIMAEGLTNGIDGTAISKLVELTPAVSSYTKSANECFVELNLFMIFYNVLFSLALALKENFSFFFDPETFDMLFERSEELLNEIEGDCHPDQQIQRVLVEHGLQRGIMMLLRENFSEAANELSKLIQNQHAIDSFLQTELHYFIGYSLLSSINQNNFRFEAISDSEAQPNSRLRVSTRRRANATNKSTLKRISVVELATDHLTKSCQLAMKTEYPRICRRTLRNFAIARRLSPDAIPHLAQSVGQSFNLRQKYIDCSVAQKRGLSCPTPEENIEDKLAESFQLLSTNANMIHQFPKVSEDVLNRLVKSRCVIVGLNIDENKENLVLWRICSMGASVRSIALPKEAHLTYDGIVERIKGIFKAAQSKAVKAGQNTTEQEKLEWWEQRYELDQAMYQILMDIETTWLGEAMSLLLPVIDEDRLEDYEQMKWTDVDMENFNKVVAALDEEDHQQPTRRGRKAVAPKKKRASLGQLVLIVDTVLERISWESLPLMRKSSVSATRAPSLSFLNNPSEDVSTTLSEENVFYLINPGGDLHKTEARLQNILDFQEDWNGIIGKANADEIARSYDGEDILLFCGHGTGDVYFNPRRVCKYTKAPVALLMGCSSARPKNLGIGDCESNGTAIDYLIRGSRAVVGCLWDVSDGDLDRLTLSMISLWFGRDADGNQSERYSLADAIARARNVCRFPSLVGASCIVMGNPNIYISSS